MKNHANITLIFSILFLLIAGAFTLTPETNNLHTNTPLEEIANQGPELKPLTWYELEEVALKCYTCTFGSGGEPNGCKNAEYCGMEICEGSCEMDGQLCGPDCGLY